MMTTPERLRKRQRRETAGIAFLAFGLAGSTVYFVGQDAAQDRCLREFVKNDTDTSAIRSDAVETESKATRDIIRGVFGASTRRQVQAAYEEYKLALEAIDATREENPIKPFPDDLCGL